MIGRVESKGINPYLEPNMSCENCGYHAWQPNENGTGMKLYCKKGNNGKGRLIPNVWNIPLWCPKKPQNKKQKPHKEQRDGYFI